MSGFEPGPGWRPLGDDEVLDEGAEVLHYSTGDDMRSWIREAPVSPLPTEPYTVIRATFPGAPATLFVHDGDLMRQVSNVGWLDTEPGVKIEVLAEPRAVTAKAILDRVRMLDLGAHAERQIDTIAREFGVEP